MNTIDSFVSVLLPGAAFTVDVNGFTPCRTGTVLLDAYGLSGEPGPFGRGIPMQLLLN